MGYAQHLIQRQELGVLVTTAVVHVLPLVRVFWPRLPRYLVVLFWLGSIFAWISSPLLAAAGSICLFILFLAAFVPLWKTKTEARASADESLAILQNGRIVFVDYFRSCIMVMIVTALWASDFAFFPPQHQKSLMTGLSLLDLGPGAMVYMNGVIAANPHKTHKGFRYTTFLPLVCLGLIERFWVGNGPAAEAEYGRDWNIYFTLAGVMVLHHWGMRLYRHNSWVACCGNAIFYELLLIAPILPLGHTPEEYSFCLTRTLNKRNNFVLANLQGLMSTIGFTTISFSSRAVGEIYYKPWTDRGKKLGLVAAITVGVVVYLILTKMGTVIGRFDLLLGIALSDRFEPSRKLASMTYVIYMYCFLNFHSLVFLLVQTNFGLHTPWLMKLVGKHQLLVFAVATFLVATCDKLFDPLKIPLPAAVPLILIYVIVCCILLPTTAASVHQVLFRARQSERRHGVQPSARQIDIV